MPKGRLTAEFSQRMRPDAAFDLDAEVANAYRFFPELKGNTYFINAATGRLVHPDASKKTQARVLKNPEVRKVLKECREEKRSQYYKTDTKPLNVVFLYLADDAASVTGHPDSYSEGQRNRAVFDHELGHALTLRTKRAYDIYSKSSLHMETMADNFSLMRQFQRYGSRSRQVREGKLIDMTAMAFLFGEEEHLNYFSGPSLEKIASVKRRFDFSTLSPQETVDVARGAALKNLPPVQDLRRIRAELETAKGENILPVFSKKLLKTEFIPALKWGKAALRHLMEPKFASYEAVRAFKKSAWPKMRGRIHERELQLRRTAA
jgi:hypothetical protein